LDSNPLIFFSSGTPNNAHPVRTSPNWINTVTMENTASLILHARYLKLLNLYSCLFTPCTWHEICDAIGSCNVCTLRFDRDTMTRRATSSCILSTVLSFMDTLLRWGQRWFDNVMFPANKTSS
jgi:hypothetical protein